MNNRMATRTYRPKIVNRIYLVLLIYPGERHKMMNMNETSGYRSILL
ncbi:hypothetical protein BH24GEM3_BH24GEM3_11850 [soil metagenome]